MKKTFHVKKIFIASVISLVGLSSCFAAEEFNNNVLKLDVAKNASGGVKLTIYTKKPYNDVLTVNKKSETEYVILLPETANSLTAKPNVKGASDIVQNVDVKTQQFSSGTQKGYTKITISTNKAAEISANTQTVKNSDYLLNEKDYKELLSQGTKKVTSKASAQASKIKQEIKKEVAIASKKEEKTETKQKQIKEKISTKPAENKIVKTPQKEKITKITAQNKAVKEPQKLTASAPINKAVETKAVEPKSDEPKVAVTKETIIPSSSQNTVPVSAPEANQTQVQPNMPEAAANPQTQDTSAKIHAYKKLIKDNIYIILLATLAPLLLISIISRKLRKKPQQPSQNQSWLNEEASTEEEERSNWKEKFQNTAKTPSAEQNQDVQELNTLFSEEVFQNQEFQETEPAHDIQESTGAFSQFIQDESDSLNLEPELDEDEYSQDDNVFDELSQYEEFSAYSEPVKEYSIDEIFGTEDSSDEQGQTGLIQDNFEDANDEETELIKSSYHINSDSGFHLVSYEEKTSLIGYIKDEVFVLKTFDYDISGQIHARLSEDKGLSKIYMLKAQNFKALINVEPNDMKILIEL